MAKVTVVNRGPGDVKIEVQSRNALGRFSAASEHIIVQDSVKDFDIDNGQSIQVVDTETRSAPSR